MSEFWRTFWDVSTSNNDIGGPVLKTLIVGFSLVVLMVFFSCLGTWQEIRKKHKEEIRKANADPKEIEIRECLRMMDDLRIPLN